MSKSQSKLRVLGDDRLLSYWVNLARDYLRGRPTDLYAVAGFLIYAADRRDVELNFNQAMDLLEEENDAVVSQ